MKRIKCLVNVLALSLIFVGVRGVGLAQEKPRKPQDGPRTSMIDELWRQMGQLQKQIVGLEVGDVNPRATPRLETLPGNIAQARLTDIPLRRKSDGKPGEVQSPVQTPVPAPKTVPGPEKLPKLRDSTNEVQIDQLWRQITALQKTVLKLEIGDVNPRLLAIATSAANGNDQTEASDNASTSNPDRTSSNGQKREPSQKTIPGQQKPLEPRGGSNDAQIAQLWQQIGQLYKQIVALELGDTR